MQLGMSQVWGSCGVGTGGGIVVVMVPARVLGSAYPRCSCHDGTVPSHSPR